jgi:hypothetical protein
VDIQHNFALFSTIGESSVQMQQTDEHRALSMDIKASIAMVRLNALSCH